MNVNDVKKLIADGNTAAVEDAWMSAIEQRAPLAAMRQVLEALLEAGRAEQAQTLGWMLITEMTERLAPREALDVARSVLPLLPGNDELRLGAAELYRRVHGQAECFEDFLKASGLLTTQSLKRAVQTLDMCLAIRPGMYLANRFDRQVVRAGLFDPVLGCWRLTVPSGDALTVEPKLLADEFDRVDDIDFRVLCTFGADRLGGLLTDDIGAALAGICMARGGRVTSDQLKDLLVPRHIEPGKWNGWWGRARTAAKRAKQLTLEGRNPVVIAYHPQGRTLEQEMESSIADARVPKDYFVILQEYLREARTRKQKPDAALVGRLLDTLAEQAQSYRTRRPDDALAAAIIIDAAVAWGLPAPSRRYPAAAETLAASSDPALAVARLDDPALWPAAMEALAQRPDAADPFERLLGLMPFDQLDAVARKLIAAGRREALDRAVVEALAAPAEKLQICLWLWRGSAEAVRYPGTRLDLLRRLLDVMQNFDREHLMDRTDRRDAFQQIRATLTHDDCATFRKAVEEMSKDVAETMKRRIARCPGLTDTSRDALLAILREKFYDLFVTIRVEPWRDESVLWTTAGAMHRQEAKLKEVIEIEIPANSRAIGAAAAHGDLSENSEWKYALEEQRRLQARQIQLQNDLIRARTITPEDVPAGSVGIGSRVTLRRTDTDERIELTFLGPWDADVDRNIYSYNTKLGLALMGKGPGETATLKIGGAEAQYVIERTESAL